jgi:flavin reductase (DIM6/NTAB) family NADH-FMN oxidoreductase RutF
MHYLEAIFPPPIDPAELRSALGMFPTGVAVVTAEGANGEGRVGMTITSFNSVSINPPLVLFSISKKALSLRVLRKAPMYSINVLGQEHQHISTRFATANTDKWAGMEVDCHDGLPFTLADSSVAFQCEPFAEYEGGDHLIFVGQVLRIHRRESKAPLVFYAGKYAAIDSAVTACAH